MENEAIGKNLPFSDQCLKTCRNSTEISGNFETFFFNLNLYFLQNNTNCKKFQKICREKFRVFRKVPTRKKSLRNSKKY